MRDLWMIGIDFAHADTRSLRGHNYFTAWLYLAELATGSRKAKALWGGWRSRPGGGGSSCIGLLCLPNRKAVGKTKETELYLFKTIVCVAWVFQANMKAQWVARLSLQIVCLQLL